MELKTGRNCHALYNLEYHLIFVTKYRRKCINAEVFKTLRDQIERVITLGGRGAGRY